MDGQSVRAVWGATNSVAPLPYLPQLEKLKRPGYMGSLVAGGRTRYREMKLTQGWEAQCIRLGFTERWADGTRRVPALRSVSVRETEMVYSLKPLAQQPISEWAKMAEALRRDVGAPLMEWRESAPGVLDIRLSMIELPQLVPYPAGLPIDGFNLGLRAGGGLAVWQPFEVPHLLVTGTTDGGKGTAVRVILAQAVAQGWRTLIINPKASGEFGWLKRHGVPVANHLEDMCQLLRWLGVELSARQRYVESYNVGSWRKLAERGQLPAEFVPLLLVVDEASVLLIPNKADKNIEKQQNEAGTILANVTAVGRAVGIHVVLTTQRPDASTLGPAGGQLRNNIDGRLAVGMLDSEGLRMMFGSGDADMRRGMEGIKGRGLAARLRSGEVAPYQVQGFWLDEEDERVWGIRPKVAQGFIDSIEHERSGQGAEA